MQEDIPRLRPRMMSNQLRDLHQVATVPQAAGLIPSDYHQMLQNSPDAFLDEVALSLALNILEQVSLPPICVNWQTGFHILVQHFKLD